MFGRMGCSIAHDHPGLESDLWFAVQYPHGGRFDLGGKALDDLAEKPDVLLVIPAGNEKIRHMPERFEAALPSAPGNGFIKFLKERSLFWHNRYRA